MNKNELCTTNGRVHAGFSSFRAFVARKKSRCKLIGNSLEIPHETLPSTVSGNGRKISINLTEKIIKNQKS